MGTAEKEIKNVFSYLQEKKRYSSINIQQSAYEGRKGKKITLKGTKINNWDEKENNAFDNYFFALIK